MNTERYANPFPHTVSPLQEFVEDFTTSNEYQVSFDWKISRLNFLTRYLVLARFQDDKDKPPRKPRLYVSKALAEFRDEVVKCILREMRQEKANWQKEMTVALIVDEVAYDVTEDIKEYQKAMKFYKKIGLRNALISSSIMVGAYVTRG